MSDLVTRWQRCMRGQTDKILDALVERYDPRNPDAFVAVEDLGFDYRTLASTRGDIVPYQEVEVTAAHRIGTGVEYRGFELRTKSSLRTPAELREIAERTRGMTCRAAELYRLQNPPEPEVFVARLSEPMRTIVAALVANPNAHAADAQNVFLEREARERAERHADDAWQNERSRRLGELRDDLNRQEREGRQRIAREMAAGG